MAFRFLIWGYWNNNIPCYCPNSWNIVGVFQECYSFPLLVAEPNRMRVHPCYDIGSLG